MNVIPAVLTAINEITHSETLPAKRHTRLDPGLWVEQGHVSDSEWLTSSEHTHPPILTFLPHRLMNVKLILSKSCNDSMAWSRPNSGGSDRHATVAEKDACSGNWFRLLLSAMRSWSSYAVPIVCLLTAVFGIVGSAQAQSSTIDLSVRQAVSSQNPAIGDVLTYTVVVANHPNSATATGTSVKNELPTDGVAYVPGSASVVRGSGTYAAATGIWSVGTVVPADSSVLLLKVTVLK